ncbi:hypothetical protein TEHAL1_19040 [Tetragenococcus halophilus]|uniref:Uncharacterized protein n=2 Tax=Tetragenococcus halophilus TaxID=51669 RepID=A0AAN1SJ49_TETHN|nr:hypothetical protein TEH_20790 [Tetragenococcus halophilus NBRC 12172]GBD70398.1 putative uncharacterized protein [Tetragenococcus halophilus subsp. halophilus]GFK22904.1 hypothetical protein WJ7_23670 [Tetragenococcus halophilus]GBD72422.1 putative uncharacterized protein [Tetragenococcus halophilus subsp. halophilus]GBD74615.1 putative uncharacterized protein [Tetragenococcus halophilus subsp. halophilus]
MKWRKFCWIMVIILDLVLFTYGFIYKNWILSIIALGLILIVRLFAYDLLFKKFDEKWDKKHKNYKKRKKEIKR